MLGFFYFFLIFNSVCFSSVDPLHTHTHLVPIWKCIVSLATGGSLVAPTLRGVYKARGQKPPAVPVTRGHPSPRFSIFSCASSTSGEGILIESRRRSEDICPLPEGTRSVGAM